MTSQPLSKKCTVVNKLLNQQGSATISEISQYINLRFTILQKILTHFEVEKIIVKERSTYHLVRAGMEPDYGRWNAITSQRYNELSQMQSYIEHDECLMRFIASALDDPTNVQNCGHCKNCANSESKFTLDKYKVESAREFLRFGNPILFTPRKRWIKGVPGINKTTDLLSLEEGVALCYYYESGWGEQVRQAREANTHYDDELVEASVQLLKKFISNLDMPPQLVTSIPSMRRPDKVPGFAAKVAELLNLEYRPLVRHVKQHEPQIEMQNSYHQVVNVIDAFAVENSAGRYPILLVDDIADSKWTMTAVGHFLRKSGYRSVYPFVLALK